MCPVVDGLLRPDPVFRAQAGLRRPARWLLVQREQDACDVAAIYQKGVAGVSFRSDRLRGKGSRWRGRTETTFVASCRSQIRIIRARCCMPMSSPQMTRLFGRSPSGMRSLWSEISGSRDHIEVRGDLTL